jgi:hypothetical protein
VLQDLVEGADPEEGTGDQKDGFRLGTSPAVIIFRVTCWRWTT